MASNGNRKQPASPARKPAGRGTTITAKQKSGFLDALANAASLEAAARTVGLTRRPFYALRRTDPDFDQQVKEALEAGSDMVEQQLVEIAFGRVPARSTAQVTACFGLLRARRPRIWRENQKEPPPDDSAPADFSEFTDEQLDRVTELLAKAHADRIPERLL